jgi:hypothetical protein
MSEPKAERKSERRFTERYRIPDALIYYRQLRKLNWFNNFQGPCVLNDIASNSASFECPHDLGIKKQVELKISSRRSKKEISVKGQIARRDTKTKSGDFIYVVQFSPFGKGYQYNSYMSKENMRAFIKTVQNVKDV